MGGERRRKAKALAAGEDPDGDAATLDVLAALEKFAPVHPDPEAFLECLEPLQPRLYSISSSPLATPGEVHLTVDAVRYDIAGRAAAWASPRPSSPIGSSPARASRSTSRRRTASPCPRIGSTPIIMVGPGTGVAPFRSFLWHRKATKAHGHAPGCSSAISAQATDFFYRDELDGLPCRRHADAGSRPPGRATATSKVYVQDRMREAGAELWSWLQGRRALLRVRRCQAHGQGRRDRARRDLGQGTGR